jgi:hypothetical protein
MINFKSSSRRFLFTAALLAVGSAFGFAPVLTAAANAAELPALRDLDDKAPALPLAATFAKAEGEDGPYVLSLKNTSNSTLKVSAKILLSVYFHADSKARNVPEHAVDAGQVWTIPGLAANDKVTVTADGFAPLELTVP